MVLPIMEVISYAEAKKLRILLVATKCGDPQCSHTPGFGLHNGPPPNLVRIFWAIRNAGGGEESLSADY